MTYDLIVIGAGPGGYHGALQAAANNLKTIVIEKSKLGGVCLNEGCIPTKTLLHSAKMYRCAKSDAYGYTAENVRFHHDKVLQRKNEVLQKLGAGIRGQLRAGGVEIREGQAQILERSPDGFRVQAGDEIIQGRNLLVATGASPAIPPIPGLKESFDQGIAVTSREILDIPQLPKSLTIIGGGIIGLEMAEYFATTGTHVTVIEAMDQIGGQLDRQIAETFLTIMRSRGIRFELNASVTQVDGRLVRYEKDGKSFEAESDTLLVCTGRKPNVKDIGLERIGVEITRGAVTTDDTGRTNIPGVYAAGDVNGKSMLAHTAYREAEVCVNHIAGKKDRVRYGNIPAVVYTTPEIAFVGETEQSAKSKGIDYGKAVLPMNFNGRYLVEKGDPEGFIKLLVDRQYNRLIGVHILGNYASEIIYGAAMMLETEFRITDIQELVFPHPSVSEIMKDAVHHYMKHGGMSHD